MNADKTQSIGRSNSGNPKLEKKEEEEEEEKEPQYIYSAGHM